MTLVTDKTLDPMRLFRSRTFMGLLILATTTLVLQPSIAAKPGSTGSQSTASLGISLTIPSSVRARYIQPTKDSLVLAKHSKNYLCINSQNPKGFRYFLIENSANIDAPTLHTLHLSERVNETSKDPVYSDCGLALNIDVVKPQQNEQTPLLLIISPE